MASDKEGIEEAVYPQEELLKYDLIKIRDKPANTSKHHGVSKEAKTVQAETENVQIVKIKRRKKQKVQLSASTSGTLRQKFSEQSLRHWYKRIHWKNLTIVMIVPLIGICSMILLHPPILKKTVYFLIWNYIITMLSINILYHRYWSHHTFEFTNVQLIQLLTIIASGGGITSAQNWCISHRAHHRYCDITYSDPHNIRRGLFFSHMGWMILIHHPKAAKAIKESKLDELPNADVVEWQQKHYLNLMIAIGLIIPCLVCGFFWNDYLGGLVYGGFLKLIMVQHSVFAINSIGHTIGTRPYNNNKSHRNNYLLSFITMGEGNQNFHHEFPMDYRNGYEWYNFDPVKWGINFLYLFGLVDSIRTASQNTINQSLIQQQQRLLDGIRSQLNWGIPIEKLPIFSAAEFKHFANKSKDRYLVVVAGIIHDVTPFAKDHPGGVPLIRASHGRDATTAFDGAVYKHSNAARNLLATMRIGKLDGSESLYWKQQRMENKNVPIDKDTEGQRIVRTQETHQSQLGSTAGAA